MKNTESRITDGFFKILKWIVIFIVGFGILYFGRGVATGIGRFLIPVAVLVWLAWYIGKYSGIKGDK